MRGRYKTFKVHISPQAPICASQAPLTKSLAAFSMMPPAGTVHSKPEHFGTFHNTKYSREICFGSQLQAAIHHGGKNHSSRSWRLVMFHLHSTHTLCFLLFGIQVQGMVTPTGTSLPIPVNLNKISPHRPASRPLFQVILDLTELMIEKTTTVLLHCFSLIGIQQIGAQIQGSK